ncbi:hypothetical protein ACFO0N_10720 [Halobium salinum]|uniref:Amphi-Trp domain-containing protein n=1 Tax=Halobium salinum TaxID=1364940 RepID=A0ABD5PD57_9EURY|nr:hypothetical protein [Halobium salinum]
MTSKAPQTKEEFAERIEALIHGAESNGLDIEGGYVLRSTNGDYDWDMELFPVVKEKK